MYILDITFYLTVYSVHRFPKPGYCFLSLASYILYPIWQVLDTVLCTVGVLVLTVISVIFTEVKVTRSTIEGPSGSRISTEKITDL
jgi:hypothetical protein